MFYKKKIKALNFYSTGSNNEREKNDKNGSTKGDKN